MSTVQAVINSENMFNNSKINMKQQVNSLNKELCNGDSVIYPNNLEEQFKAACETIQSLPKNGPFQPSNEMLLKFYAYFKQATVGPCKTTRPGIFKVVERAKYDAWYSVKELNKEQAMQGYIDEIKKIIETMPHNEFVQKLINIIGPFYEFVDEKNQPFNPSDVNDDEENDRENDVKKESQNDNINSIINNQSSFKPIINGMKTDWNSKKEKINGNDVVKMLKNDANDLLNLNGNSNGFAKIEENKKTDYSGTLQINEATSDDDEDYCDTSDYLNEQEILIQKHKKQNKSDLEPVNNRDFNFNKVSNKLNGFEKFRKNPILNHSNQDLEFNHALNSNSKFEMPTEPKFSPIIQKFGGEMNSPPGNFPYSSHNQNRFSRPGSSQSLGYGQNRFGQSSNHNHGAAGGMGGGGSGNENFLVQDTNRQILLILLRLQQDTSNVLTRLSYLESSVLSLQSSKYDNGLQLNDQVPSAFSVFSSPKNRTKHSSNSYGFLIDMFLNIDWKTVAVSILWPFIIKLAFFILKKIRLIMKFRKKK